MSIYSLGGLTPKIHPDAYVAPSADILKTDAAPVSEAPKVDAVPEATKAEKNKESIPEKK